MTYEEFKKRIDNGFLTWNPDDKSYHDANGHRYDTYGEELLDADLDPNFEDVKRRLVGGWRH